MSKIKNIIYIPKEIPLVSVPIVTYNSSKTIVETLDSVYNQTYPNIELIVSDDASPDNTLDVVHEWLDTHKARFTRVEVVTVPNNKGVTANYNRALKACTGEWVKDFDGDDIMLPECIQTYVDYVTKHPDTIFLFAKVQPFCGDGADRREVEIPLNYDFFNWSIEEQYEYLTFTRNEIPAPTAFYNKKAIEQFGFQHDERIPMMEDWPKWVNLLKKGVRFHFIDEPLVMYRVSEQSISNTSTPSKAYRQSLALFYLYYQHEEFCKKDKLLAIKKYINAKKQLNDNLFWKIANREIKAIYKRIRHEQE